MKLIRVLSIVVLALAACSTALARQRVAVSCSQGGITLSVPGGPSLTPEVISSNPGCLVSVYLTGTLTLVPLYSDNDGTPLSNPFTVSTPSGFFYVDATHVDTQFSGGGISPTFTTGDVVALDLGYDVTVNTLTTFSVNIALGAAMCNGTEVHYGGGTLSSLTPSADNFIYLDTTAACVPASNTTGFSSSTIPLAEVFTNGSGITNIITRAGMVASGGGGSSTGCVPTGTLDSVLFINPLGACDGVLKFTTNDAGQVDISHTGTFEIDSPLVPLNNYVFSQGHQVFVQSDSSNYDGSTNDGFTAYVNDNGTPPQGTGSSWPPVSATQVVVGSSFITISAANASTTFLLTGGGGLPETQYNYAFLSAFTGGVASCLNGNIAQVLNADTTEFVIANNVGEIACTNGTYTVTGTAALQLSSNPSPFFSSPGVQWGGQEVSFNSQTGGEHTQASVLIDFLAGAYGDGPEFGYGFDAQPHDLVQVESSQFLAEDDAGFSGNHNYAFKVGNQNATPWWWVYTDGTNFSRSGYNNVASSSIGSCHLSTGLDDCTATLASNLGPPTTEVFTIKVCANGALYDTFDWAEDGNTPTCSSQHMFQANPIYPSVLADDINIYFGSATGHTVGATAPIAVTVTYGTQLGVQGGSYLASVALPTPSAPYLTANPAGADIWSYCVAQSWNLVTAGCSAAANVSGTATLDSGDTVTINVGNSEYGGAATCYVYRTASGGTPSTTGLIAGPVDCQSTVIDNGLAGDSGSPPSTNLTGHATLNDGYFISSTGLFYFPQVTGSGCIGITSGAVGSAAVSCSGGGGSPGSPNLSIQGNSSTSFVGIPATLFSATNGITQIENKGSVGITLDSTATDFSGGGTGPIVFKSAGKILGSDNSSTGIEFLEAGSGHLDLWATGAGGLIFDATGNGSGTGAGSGALTGYSKAGIALTDNSSTGITLTESGASSITFVGAVTATSTINAATGFEIGGAAASGHYLRGNGTNYVDGTIQAGDLPATVVLTNQSNTFSAGTQSFAAAAHLYAPVGAGAVGATNGEFDFDSTGKNYHGFADGANSIFSSFAAGLGPVNGDCVTWIVSGSNVLQGDSGNPCGSGGRRRDGDDHQHSDGEYPVYACRRKPYDDASDYLSTQYCCWLQLVRRLWREHGSPGVQYDGASE